MIIQVGHYPPPIGGISMYIKRMKDALYTHGIENQVWDISNINKSADRVVKMPLRFLSVPLYYAVKQNVTLIHYNIPGTLIKNYVGFFNRLFFKKRPKLLTIHGDCRGLFAKKKGLIRKSLNSFNAIICVKKNDREYLLNQGVSTHVYEIPAFIPPTVQETEIAEISQRVWDFINAHRPVVAASACKIVFRNAQDLYGLDMCIDLCANLKKDYPQIGVVFCLPHIGDCEYFEKMKQAIMKKGIENNFLFHTRHCQLYPIIMRSDVFVRPSTTDGDAVSVREALHFKTPTVASDVAPRPERTILFRNRDVDDLTSKVGDLLDNYESHKRKLEGVKLEDNFEKIMKVYQGL
ncbi:MAG: hypothetical protein BA873_01980 [Desulfobulbaceae bacterium C00003063]|nr:MAG: hypothetical protein BA873_01980 [Desulfobulbaceae bacterium C00003063]